MDFNPETLSKALYADLGRTKPFTDESTIKHVAAKLLQDNLLKKYTNGDISKVAEQNAFEKFMNVNAKVAEWVLPVEGTDEHRLLVGIKKRFASQLIDYEGFPKLTLAKAFNRGNVGPGAAVDATDENFVDKLFNSCLSCTNPILLRYYKQAICGWKPWWHAERRRRFIHGDCRVVEGNKLFFVPKETIIARTAATEPTLNMFGQLGYGKLIEEILERYHDINLSTQPDLNRWLAMSGSLSGDYATIDLSTASDTIGLRLCREILPSKVFQDLTILRSPTTKYRGKAFELHMISTMGNGFTFPLQTLIFANLVLTVLLEAGIPVRDQYGKRRYSVFGDDIIVPREAYDLVCKALSTCGFTVNDRKSFVRGKFRESCGGDYFAGHNVRAVYCKHVRHDAHVYSLINRLNVWTALHGVGLPKTVSYLVSLVKLRPIPLYEDETAGIRLPRSRLLNRKIGDSGGYIYHCLVQRPDRVCPLPFVIDEFYHAFHVAFLHGSFAGGRLGLRTKEGHERFQVVKRSSVISWDFTSNARITSEDLRNAIETNMPL